MENAKERVVLAELLAATISYCEREITAMNGSVRLLEKEERRRLMDRYREGHWWRGLADPDFARMVDALVLLTDGQFAMSVEQSEQ